MEEFDIKEIINSLNAFNNQRNYWFIRTQGGDFYKTFLENSYIAIGYDSINLSIIKNAANDKSGKTLATSPNEKSISIKLADNNIYFNDKFNLWTD